jgi:hypothetical protein
MVQSLQESGNTERKNNLKKNKMKIFKKTITAKAAEMSKKTGNPVQMIRSKGVKTIVTNPKSLTVDSIPSKKQVPMTVKTFKEGKMVQKEKASKNLVGTPITKLKQKSADGSSLKIRRVLSPLDSSGVMNYKTTKSASGEKNKYVAGDVLYKFGKDDLKAIGAGMAAVGALSKIPRLITGKK